MAHLFATLAAQRGVFAPFAARLAGRVCAALVFGKSVFNDYLDVNEAVFGGDLNGEDDDTLAVLRQCRRALKGMPLLTVIDCFRDACIAVFWFNHSDAAADAGSVSRKKVATSNDVRSLSLKSLVENGFDIDFNMALSKAIQTTAAGRGDSASAPGEMTRPLTCVTMPNWLKQPLSNAQAFALLSEQSTNRETLATCLAGERIALFGGKLSDWAKQLTAQENFTFQLTAQKKKAKSEGDIDVDESPAAAEMATQTHANDGKKEDIDGGDDSDDQDSDDSDDEDEDYEAASDDDDDDDEDGEGEAKQQRKFTASYARHVLPLYIAAVRLNEEVQRQQVDEISVCDRMFFYDFVRLLSEHYQSITDNFFRCDKFVAALLRFCAEVSVGC